jgi:hypothetical protein
VTTAIASQRLFRGQMKERAMKFASTRLIAADIKSLVSFYEKVTNRPAEWLAPIFAEIVTPAATLAILCMFRASQCAQQVPNSLSALGTSAPRGMTWMALTCSRWWERSPGLATSPRWCLAPIISSA